METSDNSASGDNSCKDDACLTEAFLQVSELTVQFAGEREIVALSKTSLEVKRGEFVCVLGPSGCGKSTLLNVIGGFVKPTGGSVRVSGKLITRPGLERGIAFQQNTLFPWKTVRGNIALGPRLKGLPKDEVSEIVDRLILLVGLGGFEKSYPHELSGGMAQRVGLARLLASEPEVLLMDEPFGSLDAQTRIDMQETLLKVWERSRKTVLFVTHDIDEALLLSDRILLMSRRPGRILETFNVPFPRPRVPTLLNSSEVFEFRNRIFSLIRKEQRKAQGTI